MVIVFPHLTTQYRHCSWCQRNLSERGGKGSDLTSDHKLLYKNEGWPFSPNVPMCTRKVQVENWISNNTEKIGLRWEISKIKGGCYQAGIEWVDIFTILLEGGRNDILWECMIGKRFSQASEHFTNKVDR